MILSSLNKGLVGHWPLDQESFNPNTKRFTDKSAYSNHGAGNGTQLGSADPGFQSDRMGQLVRSAPFNGSNDYINLGSITSGHSLMLNGSDVTISAWIKQQSGGDTYQRIIDKSDAGAAANGYAILLNPASRTVHLNVNTGVYDSDNGVYEFDTWTHIIGIITAAGGSIYVDGQVVSGTGSIGQPPNAVANMRIGTWNHDVAREFNGDLADVRIYNRALSQQEITLLYNSYRPKVII